MTLKRLLAGAFALVVGFSIGVVAGPGYPVIIANWLGDGAKANTSQFKIQIPSSGSSAVFVPGTTNTNALGSTSLRFSNVYTTLLNLSGIATFGSSATFAGPVVGNGGVTLFNSTAPRTATDIAGLYTSYSPSTGTLFYNSQDKMVCISTGLLQSTIALSSAPTVACPH